MRMKESKETTFKINTKKRNVVIAITVAVVVVIAGIITGAVIYHNNSVKTEIAEATTTENETTEVAEVEEVEETEVTTEETKTEETTEVTTTEETTEADTTNETILTGSNKPASDTETVENTKPATNDTKPATTNTPTPVHTHSYTSSVTTQPTCGQNGVRTYKCSCGDTYTESVAATGNHNYVKASCTSDTCSTCGATRSADHHNWVTTTKTIEVPAVTHIEDVDRCNCGAWLRTDADYDLHTSTCGGYYNSRVEVVDSEATTRTETITSCSVCGTTK
jgi:flagellar basal body-associated protein FliL